MVKARIAGEMEAQTCDVLPPESVTEGNDNFDCQSNHSALPYLPYVSDSQADRPVQLSISLLFPDS